jgi:hypothetical protein
MPDYIHGDKIGGDKVGRDKIVQRGHHGSIRANNTAGGSEQDIRAAIEELRAFIGELHRDGVVGDDGSVRDPAKIVDKVKERPSRFVGLRAAIAGGAKDAILAAVKDGVASLIVALFGHPS